MSNKDNYLDTDVNLDINTDVNLDINTDIDKFK